MCPLGHSYDVAHSGYVNLLQPQDRRSLTAGDSKAVVQARVRLLASGVGRSLLEGIVQRIEALDPPPQSLVVDLGSGTGDTLGLLAASRPISGVGIDLSVAAVEHAARRFPSVTWVVANGDRRLPIKDRGAAVIMSIHARRQPAECARILGVSGTLLVAVPGCDDLIELRHAVQGTPVERERGNAVMEEHARLFVLVERFTIQEQRTLPRDALTDLLTITYRGGRSRVAERAERLTELTVTLASDVFLFAAR